MFEVATPEEFPTGLRCAACHRIIEYYEPFTAQLVELGGECGPDCPPPEECLRHADIEQLVCVECGQASPLADDERDEAYEVVAEVVPQRPTHVYAWMLRWPVHVLVSGSYMTPEEAFPYRPKASEGVEVRLLKIALPPSEES